MTEWEILKGRKKRKKWRKASFSISFLMLNWIFPGEKGEKCAKLFVIAKYCDIHDMVTENIWSRVPECGYWFSNGTRVCLIRTFDLCMLILSLRTNSRIFLFSGIMSSDDISITSKEELLMPYLTALVDFRENIRKVAREQKIIAILDVCIRFLLFQPGIFVKSMYNYWIIIFTNSDERNTFC